MLSNEVIDINFLENELHTPSLKTSTTQSYIFLLKFIISKKAETTAEDYIQALVSLRGIIDDLQDYENKNALLCSHPYIKPIGGKRNASRIFDDTTRENTPNKKTKITSIASNNEPMDTTQHDSDNMFVEKPISSSEPTISYTGKTKMFHMKRNYGFIIYKEKENDQDDKEIFYHRSSLPFKNRNIYPRDHQDVKFKIRPSGKSGKFEAYDIQSTDDTRLKTYPIFLYPHQTSFQRSQYLNFYHENNHHSQQQISRRRFQNNYPNSNYHLMRHTKSNKQHNSYIPQSETYFNLPPRQLGRSGRNQTAPNHQSQRRNDIYFNNSFRQ